MSGGLQSKGEAAELLVELGSRWRSPLNWLLDMSIFYSFDASGLRRHRRAHQSLHTPSFELSLQHHYLITGANSGLGFALADQLMARGATVSILCRDIGRGERAVERLKQKHKRTPQLLIADLTDLSAIDQASEQFVHKVKEGNLPPPTCLVHNAGLLPLRYELTSTGHELTVGAHLIGPMRLTARILPIFSTSARVIFMSSGGMYTAPLDVGQMIAPPTDSKYDGVYAYALTKRAQVELSSMLHHRLSQLKQRKIDVQSVHPGWADTPGVAHSLSTFHRKMRGRLRTADEGAEAVAWLCMLPSLPTSHFWFDWLPRSPYLLGKRPKAQERDRLWEMVCQGAQLSQNWYLD